MQDLTSRPLPLLLFGVISAMPLVLFTLGLSLGGFWTLAALIYMTGLAALMDQVVALFLGDAAEGAEFPGADGLLVGLAIGHLVLMPAIVSAVAGASGFAVWERLALFLGAGLWFGQVSNPMAHELIHRGSRGLFWLGVTVYATLLFGHHASAHRLVHHRHAASAEDPNTARAGEGYYRFALRAWKGSFLRGFAAEHALRRGKVSLHPYVIYAVISLAALFTGWLFAGWPGVVVWVLLSAHAQSQLLLSDYVQHYGLTRRVRPDGKLEPVAARHSWNAPHWFSSGLMLNAPRHSDHHAHPARPYPALRLPGPEEAPHLPWPLPIACMIALSPDRWRRLMRPHVERWREMP